jgi:hypothetical protein
VLIGVIIYAWSNPKDIDTAFAEPMVQQAPSFSDAVFGLLGTSSKSSWRLETRLQATQTSAHFFNDVLNNGYEGLAIGSGLPGLSNNEHVHVIWMPVRPSGHAWVRRRTPKHVLSYGKGASNSDVKFIGRVVVIIVNSRCLRQEAQNRHAEPVPKERGHGVALVSPQQSCCHNRRGTCCATSVAPAAVRSVRGVARGFFRRKGRASADSVYW